MNEYLEVFLEDAAATAGGENVGVDEEGVEDVDDALWSLASGAGCHLFTRRVSSPHKGGLDDANDLDIPGAREETPSSRIQP